MRCTALVSGLLLAQANNLARFENECDSCHDSAEAFVRKSIATRISGLAGIESGVPVLELLQTHQDLQPADAEFFMKLITRVLDTISHS